MSCHQREFCETPLLFLHVIVFAMNAGGLPGSQADHGSVDPEFWKELATSRRQSLRMIAEPTGGFAVLDDVDFAGAMSRIRTP